MIEVEHRLRPEMGFGETKQGADLEGLAEQDWRERGKGGGIRRAVGTSGDGLIGVVAAGSAGVEVPLVGTDGLD